MRNGRRFNENGENGFNRATRSYVNIPTADIAHVHKARVQAASGGFPTDVGGWPGIRGDGTPSVVTYRSYDGT